MGDALSAIAEGLHQGLSEGVDELVTRGVDLDELLERIGPDALVESGRRAVLLAVSPLLWEDRLGPMMTTAEVCAQLKISRQAVAKAVHAGRLLAIPAGKTRRFPIWQFRSMASREEMVEVLAAFRDIYSDVKPIDIASWGMTPQPELDGTTPATWLGEDRPVGPMVLAAQRAAAALAQ